MTPRRHVKNVVDFGRRRTTIYRKQWNQCLLDGRDRQEAQFRSEKPKGDIAMRFMMLMIPRVYQPGAPAGEKAGEGFTPDAEIVAQMTKYNEELAKAGALIALDGLQPSSKGARISFTGGKRIVTDGPFIETKEVVGGYWM